jgi:D-threo-aldose 1-dehydrogenase
MNGRERRQLGRTSLHVSRLGIGGGSLANAPGEDAVRRLLDGCWDLGLRYFDTAAFYVAGESERRFGAALRQRPRDDYVLSTKLGRFFRNGQVVYDYTEAGAEESLGRSLDRLGLDRVDIVYIHDATPALHGFDFERQFQTAMDGAYPYLERLRTEGVVAAIGIGMSDADTALRFAKAGNFDCFMLAGAYTLLRQASLDTLLRHCGTTGSSVIVAAPFNTGILATGAVEGARLDYKPAPAEALAHVARIEAICRTHGVRLPAAALQFPLAHPVVAGIVAGHQSVAEVTQNLELLAERIPAAFWRDMVAAGLLPEHAPLPDAGAAS